MKVLAKETFDYIVFEKDGAHFIEVLCGSVAMYERTVRMTDDELAAFQADPASAKRLAQKVRDRPEAFQDRIMAKA